MSAARIIQILRRVTATVKIMPFVFLLFQLISMICFIWVDDTDTTWLDMLFYVSPIVILFEFVLSYLLELCIWHRLQCSLPLLPLSSVVIDEWYYELPSVAAEMNYVFVAIMFLASFFNGYMLFCKR